MPHHAILSVIQPKNDVGNALLNENNPHKMMMIYIQWINSFIANMI